jgi:hypothetical protein
MLSVLAKKPLLFQILFWSLFVAVLASFCIFIKVFVYSDKNHINMFSAWNFPMTTALFFELLFIVKYAK